MEKKNIDIIEVDVCLDGSIEVYNCIERETYFGQEAYREWLYNVEDFEEFFNAVMCIKTLALVVNDFRNEYDVLDDLICLFNLIVDCQDYYNFKFFIGHTLADIILVDIIQFIDTLTMDEVDAYVEGKKFIKSISKR